jgi:hypothetical protein
MFMSKFLNIVEDNTPESDIDIKTAAKRHLQRMLMDCDIKVKAPTFKDILYVELTDGRVVELEVKKVVNKSSEEEAEDPGNAISAMTAIANIPDQGFGKQLTSSSARKMQMAKRKMADAALKFADDFNKKVQSAAQY